ncbi:GLPGLI family protein [Pedobacter sp. UYP30]|uniref:hypothetical protein n=1 Tax=Pedobacter sp. UYP30 TaxID=1756400 RepID=UPI00339489FD
MKLEIKFKQQYVLLVLSFCMLFASKINAQEKTASVSEVWKIDYGLVFKSIDPLNKAKQDNGQLSELELAKALTMGDDEGPILRCYLSKGKYRVEEKGLSSSVIVYQQPDTSYYRLDTAQKVAYRSAINRPYVDVQMAGDSMIVISSDDFKLKQSEDTATVAGYFCKKAVFSMDDYPAQEITVWYSPQLPPMYWGKYTYLQKLPGCALSIFSKQQKLMVGIEAKIVEKLTVANTLFSVPTDYEKEDVL